MELKELSISFNNYAFENVGVPAKSYGGYVTYVENGVECKVPLYPGDVQDIMAVVAEAARVRMNGITQATVGKLINAASGILLEDKSKEHEDA